MDVELIVGLIVALLVGITAALAVQMVRMRPKYVVVGMVESWLPLIIPGLLLIGRLLVGVKAGRYGLEQIPADLCYYGATVYVWALTNHLSGQPFSLSYVGREGPWIITFLILNLFLYFAFFPASGQALGTIQLALALGLSFATGPLSAIYLRARS